MECLHDQETIVALQQIRNIHQTPAITAEKFSAIHRKIKWLIDGARKKGESKFADRLQSALDQGKLRYLPNLKIALAYVDFRHPDNMIFGKAFFSRTWADEIRGVDGNPIIATDQEILDWAEERLGAEGKNAYNVLGKLQISDLQKIALSIPALQPEKIRENLTSQIKASQQERYRLYFKNTPTRSFPPEMPSWIILLSHEFNHTIQLAQDQNDWKPAWAKHAPKKGLAYYTTLIRMRGSMQNQDPVQGSTQGRAFAILQEAQVKEKMIAVANAREGQATEFGIRLGMKVKDLWVKEKVKP